MIRLLLSAVIAQSASMAFCDFEFLGPDEIIAIDWDGNAVVTRDGGKSWVASKAMWMRDLIMVDSNELWGLRYTTDGSLAHSTDGGRTWSCINLRQGVPLPASFLGVTADGPLLVDQGGQVRRRNAAKAMTAEFTDWECVGERNPDQRAVAGIKAHGVIFVSSGATVWALKEHDLAWTKWAAPSSSYLTAFAVHDSMLYMASQDGSVYRRIGTGNDWKCLASVPHVARTFSIAAYRDRVLLATERSDHMAYVAIVREDGTVEDRRPVAEGQAYRVRQDGDGRAWTATSAGLFREAGTEWIRVLPRS